MTNNNIRNNVEENWDSIITFKKLSKVKVLSDESTSCPEHELVLDQRAVSYAPMASLETVWVVINPDYLPNGSCVQERYVCSHCGEEQILNYKK